MGGAQVSNFSLNDVQSQAGKVVIVTGGNSGVGFGTVKALASKGTTVIIASRNERRVNDAVEDIKKLQPGAKVEGMILDLSSFESIDRFVAEFERQVFLIIFLTLSLKCIFSNQSIFQDRHADQ